MRLSLGLVFLLPVAASLYAADSHACGYQCQGARAPNQVTFPASVPGIPVWADQGTADLEIRGPGGTLIAGTYSASTAAFLPAAPLLPGEYQLKVREGDVCSPPPDAGNAYLNTVFTVGPAAPIPTGSGTLTISSLGKGTLTSPSSGACFLDARVAYVDLAFTPDPSLAPYAPVLAYETHVSGHGRWHRTEPGVSLTLNPTLSRQALRVFVDCDPRPLYSPVRDLGLPPGLHTIEVRALLPGSANPVTSASIQFPISCDLPEVVDAGPPDGGPWVPSDAGPWVPSDAGPTDTLPPGSGQPDASESDAFTSPPLGSSRPDDESAPTAPGAAVTTNEESAASAGGGCSMHPGPSSATGVLVALGALAVRSRGRRRR